MRVKLTTIAALQLLFCAVAFAAELSPALRGLIEGFQAHRRVATGYLRTQNADLGSVEIERMRDRLAADRGKAAPLAMDDKALGIALERTASLVAESLKAADGGDAEGARVLLEEAGRPLDAWRKANGIRLFSDCIAEISAAHGPLGAGRLNAPDLAVTAVGADIVASTRDVMAVLDRCDQEASDDMRKEPEFRRLFDGMRASLRQNTGAVKARDGGLLHRLLIEQRSFEQLLSFRFG